MNSPFGGRFGGRARMLVKQHPQRRRACVIELAGFDRPEERAEKAAGDEATGADEQDDDTHGGSIRLAAQRIPPAPSAMTVSELTGISTADASGVRLAVSASARPIAL